MNFLWFGRQLKIRMRLLIFAFIMVTMTGLVFPMHQLTEGQSAQAQAPASEPIPIACSKARDQPVDPVQMNSALITSNDPDAPPYYVKTIHVEKEIFACQTGGEVSLYKDLTIYAEVFGSTSGPAFFPHLTNFYYTECDRNVSGDILSCSAAPISSGTTNLTRCAEETPIQSIEMNTLIGGAITAPTPEGAVKTITSEKHIYTCIIGDFIVPTKAKEVVSLTSLFEKGPTSAISFMGFTCIKDMRIVTVDSCSVTFTS